MGVSGRISQRTLFSFLEGTDLPVLAALAGLLRRTALTLGALGTGWFLFSILRGDPLLDPLLPFSGSFAILVAAPLMFGAWHQARHRRWDASAVLFVTGLQLLCILSVVPKGAYAAGWYGQPLIAVLAGAGLGAVPGLLVSTTGAAAVAWSTWGQGAASLASNALPNPVAHGLALIAVILACSLAGVYFNQLLLAALRAEQEQRDHIRDSRKALQHRERLLRHALRVETIGDMAGLVSHQLRNTLQVVQGHVALAEEGAPPRLDLIRAELEEARPLLDELLGLAHPDQGRPEPEDLEEFLVSYHQKLRRLLPKSTELVVDYPKRPLRALLDRRGLEHALWNLVLNGLHAMGAGGTLRIAARREDGEAVITVTDTGSGMDQDTLLRVFEPYFTTKGPGVGTGLGLTAVARFVRGSGGKIEVDSELGVGTRFVLRFPEYQREARSGAGSQGA